jgi:2-dehydro-3-deoxygalactonokinase
VDSGAAQRAETEPGFITGDWGTSRLRLFLCSAEGALLDTAEGPGAVEAHGRHAAVFETLLARWAPRCGELPAVLCGMVGSNIGWSEARYLPCAAKPDQIAEACVALQEGRIRIIPGLSCRNRYAAPDFMRGEETQILGALILVPALARGRHLLCLPGTHTKWVWLEDGAVVDFLTAPVGEIFALLAQHSVLVRDRDPEQCVAGEWFANGLQAFARLPGAPLLHRLFECRSRRLNGEFTAQQSAAYLSGLLIASDVSGALHAFSDPTARRTVNLIGAPQLTDLYAIALGAQGGTTTFVDGTAAAVAGLAHVHRLLA